MTPEPDVCVFDLDPLHHKYIVLASDGLWNMLRPQEVVNTIEQIIKDNEKVFMLNLQGSQSLN